MPPPNYLPRRRQKARDYLGGVCVVCGTTDDLDFDHIDPTTKVVEISTAMIQCWSWERLIVELDKCQLLCKPHHIEKSRRDGNHAGGHNRVTEPQHGTAVMYGREKCRCDACRRWRHAYGRGWVTSDGTVVDGHEDDVTGIVLRAQGGGAPVRLTCAADGCTNEFELPPNIYRLRLKRSATGKLGCSRVCGAAIKKGNVRMKNRRRAHR